MSADDLKAQLRLALAADLASCAANLARALVAADSGELGCSGSAVALRRRAVDHRVRILREANWVEDSQRLERVGALLFERGGVDFYAHEVAPSMALRERRRERVEARVKAAGLKGAKTT